MKNQERLYIGTIESDYGTELDSVDVWGVSDVDVNTGLSPDEDN